MSSDVMRETVWPVARLCLGFAIVHSLLASRQAKELVARTAGARYRDGLYRWFYNTQAGVSTAWVLYRVIRLPDRPLYEVPRPFAVVMWLGQALSGLMGLRAALVIGIPQMSGFAPLFSFLRGEEPQPEPEAQGPPPGEHGEMKAEGPFRFTRHPLNWAPLLFFLLFPRMTVKRATLAAMVVLYTILGSVHEEMRLRGRYGEAYERYQRGVPFLRPRLRGWHGGEVAYASQGGDRRVT